MAHLLVCELRKKFNVEKIFFDYTVQQNRNTSTKILQKTLLILA